MNQSNESIAFVAFYVFDASVAFVVFVAFVAFVAVSLISKISVQTSYQNENKSKLILSNDFVSTNIISSNESSELKFITSSNDTASAEIISIAMFSTNDFASAKIISFANFIANDVAFATIISTIMFSSNDLASAMVISSNESACNQSATDSFLSIDTFPSYEPNHSHSYASDRFLASYTQFHQTLNRLAYQELNCFKKIKINSINSTFDYLRHMFRFFTDFYICRSSNAFRISFFFSFFVKF